MRNEVLDTSTSNDESLHIEGNARGGSQGIRGGAQAPPEVHITTNVVRESLSPKEDETLAKRVSELVAAGETPEASLEIVGVSAKVLETSPLLRDVLRRVNEVGGFTADVQRELLRRTRSAAHLALFDRGMAQLNESGEAALLKEALAWDKAIAEDPAVGLKAPPIAQVNIDLKPLEGLLKEQPPAAVVFDWPEEEKA